MIYFSGQHSVKYGKHSPQYCIDNARKIEPVTLHTYPNPFVASHKGVWKIFLTIY